MRLNSEAAMEDLSASERFRSQVRSGQRSPAASVSLQEDV